jgi:lipid A 3-O-deacylase
MQRLHQAQKRYLILATFLLIFLVREGLAANTNQPPQGALFTITEENDLVVRTDRDYTQGIRFSYLSEDNHPVSLSNCFGKIPPLGMALDAQKFGLAVGQNIYTPKNKQATVVVKQDRPYAGWLYLGGIWQRRGATRGGLPMLDHVELDLGIIGPDSLARQGQTFVHEVRGFSVPRGWKNQLDDEPGVALKLERQWRFSLGDRQRWAFDFMPQLGGSLGNAATFASAGATIRAGYNLPSDFGVQVIDSLASNSGGCEHREAHNFGFYCFAGVEGRAVAFTEFLDGSVFHDGPSADKEPYAGDLRLGTVFVFKHFDLAYTQVCRTPELVHQPHFDSYGSVSVNVKF